MALAYWAPAQVFGAVVPHGAGWEDNGVGWPALEPFVADHQRRDQRIDALGGEG